ncbi:MAG: hypothetical protein ABFE13_01545 [Phycisphaerales bacterium]
MSLTAKIVLGFDAVCQAVQSLSNLADRLSINRALELTDGTGANQANVLFHDERTLADGADETLDLYGGSLLDALKNVLTMEKLKVLFLRNTSVEASLLIGGAATMPLDLFADAADVFKQRPGGVFLTTAPDANGIALTTNKNLKLAHDGTGTSALVYEIIAIGVD